MQIPFNIEEGNQKNKLPKRTENSEVRVKCNQMINFKCQPENRQ